MTDRRIGLVLDTSAVLAFVRQSVHVGEVLTEVADNGEVAAIPMSCLAVAAGMAVDGAQLDLLAGHQVTVVTGEDPGDWRALAAMCGLVGDYPAACAALIAVDSERWVLTTQPDVYAQVGGGNQAISIED